MEAEEERGMTMTQDGSGVRGGTGKESGISGISLRIASLIFMTAAFLAAATLLACHSMVYRGYTRAEEANSRYALARQAAADMQTGSDYLTDRVRSFVVTGDMLYLEEYFIESEVTKTRDNALKELEGLLQEGSQSSAYGSLSVALDYSNELMLQEYRAMCLELASMGVSETHADTAGKAGQGTAEIPEALRNFNLSREDLSLSGEEQHALAQSLAFDETYMYFKERIRENVKQCTQDLIETSRIALEEADARLKRLLHIQTMLTALLILIVLGFVLFLSDQIRKPLSHLVERMQAQETLPPQGASELRFVTQTYNEILRQNRKQQEQLTYDAMHDALTGLYNRSAYEMFLRDADLEHCALLIVDVDKFKEVNDNYGHDIGDRVLKRVAAVLRGSFRSVDIVCRIGGDEFVVIVTRASTAMRDNIVGKIDFMNRLLQTSADGLPGVSLSVGIAFSDRENPEGDIFRDADTALYLVKERGRCGCAVYGE